MKTQVHLNPKPVLLPLGQPVFSLNIRRNEGSGTSGLSDVQVLTHKGDVLETMITLAPHVSGLQDVPHEGFKQNVT